MPNPYFRFKQFTVFHDQCAMKVTTDGCLFGAWAARLLRNKQGSALDIGAGSGLLSLMVAQQSALQIDAIEIDDAAAAQAAANVASSPWATQVKVINTDILAYEAKGSYAVVISNPPFYEAELASANPGKQVAHHGEGLRLRALLEAAARLLEQGGTFLLLLPYKRYVEVQVLLRDTGWHLHQEVTVLPSEAHAPFRLLLQLGRQPHPIPLRRSLAVKDAAGTYTPAFQDLLQPYYLYL